MPQIKDSWILVSVMVMIVAYLLMATFAGCSEDTDDPDVDTAPCIQTCDDFDLCFGFDGTGETLASCKEHCDDSTQAENDCLDNCASIVDCDAWGICVQGCD